MSHWNVLRFSFICLSVNKLSTGSICFDFTHYSREYAHHDTQGCKVLGVINFCSDLHMNDHVSFLFKYNLTKNRALFLKFRH